MPKFRGPLGIEKAVNAYFDEEDKTLSRQLALRKLRQEESTRTEESQRKADEASREEFKSFGAPLRAMQTGYRAKERRASGALGPEEFGEDQAIGSYDKFFGMLEKKMTKPPRATDPDKRTSEIRYELGNIQKYMDDTQTKPSELPEEMRSIWYSGHGELSELLKLNKKYVPPKDTSTKKSGMDSIIGAAKEGWGAVKSSYGSLTGKSQLPVSPKTTKKDPKEIEREKVRKGMPKTYKTAEQVLADFKAGKITKQQSDEILVNQFGYEKD